MTKPVAMSTKSTKSRAQEFRSRLEALGCTNSQMAQWLGVELDTIGRWLAKAKADDEGRDLKRGTDPHPTRIRALRMMSVIKRTCPGALYRIAWDSDSFDDVLHSIVGPPLRLADERQPNAYSSLEVS